MRGCSGGVFKSLALLLLITAATCFAQFSGSIQGTVLDASDAAVPKATVTLTNTDTQVTQEAVTNDTGVYRFVSLAPGPYVIATSQTGFAATKISVILSTAETRNVPIKLAVGQVSTQVNVTARVATAGYGRQP